MRGKKKNVTHKECCSLKQVFFICFFILLIWFFVVPASFLRDINTNTSIHDYTKSISKSGSDQRQTPSNNNQLEPKKPNINYWTLHDATKAEIEGKNWFEKGKLIVAKNEKYLQNAIGKNMNREKTITLVSGLFDLGRGELKNDFTRSFDFYVQRFSIFLKYKFPKVIFIQPEHYHLYEPFIEASEYPIHVINKTIDEIKNFRYFNDIDKIRTDPAWYGEEQWLTNSPQAKMPLYNPMVMSKIFWTRDVAQLNPFNTDTFMWIDGK